MGRTFRSELAIFLARFPPLPFLLKPSEEVECDEFRSVENKKDSVRFGLRYCDLVQRTTESNDCTGKFLPR